MGYLIRGRFHPDLHPVLRAIRRAPFCPMDGPWFTDEDGEEVCFTCTRPPGHTGRHYDWEWSGRAQIVHVWTDAESSAREGREP